MTVEDRLREALRSEAEQVDVDPQAWARVVERTARRRRTRVTATSALGAAALIALVVGLAALLAPGDAQRLDVVPPAAQATTPTTEPAPVTTTGEVAGTTAPPPPPPAPPTDEEPDVFPAIWPFTSGEEVAAYVTDPGIGMFFDAEATAVEFARVYLRLPDPVAVAGPAPNGEVTVAPEPGSPLATTVQVSRFGGSEGPFAVVGARSANIRVDRPAALQVVGTTISLAGSSTAYEAQVDVEVREDGQGPGERLGRSFLMGGANGDLGPFASSITIERPTAAGGAVILSTESAEDGTVQEATVVRVAFGEPPVAGEQATVSVYFHRGEDLVGVSRPLGPSTAGVLKAALGALFAGPLPADGAGLSSVFSPATAGLLGDVNLTGDGTAVVDLAGTVANASTSTGSRRLLEELDATVFQFSTVQRIEYRLQGSCDAFWDWLQYGACRVVERPAG